MRIATSLFGSPPSRLPSFYMAGNARLRASVVTIDFGLLKDDDRFRLVEGLLKILPTVAFGLDCARLHARLWARLEQQGNLIGAHDLMIAATCVHEGDAIATLNAKEFSRIVELQLADCGQWVI